MYPTQEEIMEDGPGFDIETFQSILNVWKDICYKDKWSQASTLEKLSSLEFLATMMTKAKTTLGTLYSYNPDTDTISIDYNNPSIISTLHEIGHALFGSSELKACKFSVWLFKTVFPKAFQKLKWDGHMLKKDYDKD